MSQLQDYDFRSEEVKEILGTPPNWMVRYGTLVVLVGLFLIGTLFYYIKFPDKIRGDLVLNTTGAIYEVKASESGYLGDMFATDSLIVQKDQPLAIRKNGYLYTSFLDLRDEVNSLLEKKKEDALDFYPKKNLELGPFKNQFSNLTNSFDKYFESITSNNELKDQGVLKSERKKLQRDIEKQERRYNSAAQLHNEDCKNLVRLRKRIGEPNSGDLVNAAFRDSIASEERLQDIDAIIANIRGDIRTIDRQLRSKKGKKKEGNIAYWDSFQENLNNLQRDLRAWEEKYFIKAPITGRVLRYGTTWENHFFNKGDPILAIIPLDSSPIDSSGYLTATMTIGIDGYGKVETGQEVLIKFNSYPYRQFGVVRGVVVQKSLFARDKSHVVEVKVPKELQTTFNKTLASEPQMLGKGEILTKERRFLERIFVQFRSVFKNR